VDVDGLANLSDQDLLLVALELYHESSLVVRAWGRSHEPAVDERLASDLLRYMRAAHTLVTHMEASAAIMMAIDRCSPLGLAADSRSTLSFARPASTPKQSA
jgi:hypothetical protein